MNKINILVVDDSENFREIIFDFLKNQKEINDVKCVGSGPEAIEILENYSPHVILMDIVMQGMNGFEASMIVRENHPAMPIIILSGNEVTDSRAVIEKMSLNGFVNKINVVTELMPAIFKSVR